MDDYNRLTKKYWHDTKFAELNPRQVLLRLWQLETKIEKGTLIVLPCKVGDTLYYLGKTTKIENGELQSDYFITSCYVSQIDIRITDTKPTLRIELITDKLGLMIWNGEYGKTHFFNSEDEAVAKLKELKREQI